MKNKPLQNYTRKELADMARDQGVLGWHSMRKDELIAALEEAPSPKRKKDTRPSNGHARPQPAAARNTSGGSSAEEQVESAKFDVGVPTRDLSVRIPRELPTGYGKDTIVLMVRDPYWLHAYWEITSGGIRRAEAALGQDWHGSRPMLRLLEVSNRDAADRPETVVRDIDIHGGASNWYIEVQNPPRNFRVDIGYMTRNGQFYVLARSNVVATPRTGLSDVIDENWADIDARLSERIYAMSGGFDPAASSLEMRQLFQDRFQHAVTSGGMSSFGSGALMSPPRQRKFWFQLDAELIVYGATEPDAHVTLQGQPIKLRPDGTFTMRFSLPDARQIIPAVANSADGIEERTIILAVERNTKHLEPLLRDGSGE